MGFSCSPRPCVPAGAWNEDLVVASHTDLYCRLRRHLSLGAVTDSLHVRTQREDGTRQSRAWHARAAVWEKTIERRRELLSADRGLVLAEWFVVAGEAHLREGNWGRAVRRTASAFTLRRRRRYATRQAVGAFAAPALQRARR